MSKGIVTWRPLLDLRLCQQIEQHSFELGYVLNRSICDEFSLYSSFLSPEIILRKVEWAESFEPYFIVSSDVPRFDERFVGYGINKASHMMELWYRGYELEVLPEAFIVHMPHPPSRDKLDHKSSYNYYSCQHALMGALKREMKNNGIS